MAGTPPTPEAPARRRRSTGQRVVLGSGVAVAVLCLVAAGVIFGLARKFDLIPRLGADTQLDAAGDDEARNYLVVGSDSREGIDEDDPNAQSLIGGSESPDGKRADVIMIVRVDPAGERLDLLSLPRDLWVPIAGTGENQRINTAYAGGAQQLIDTIRDDFGIEINHYVEIDFKGFQGIVDTVGGVPMYFDRAMRDTSSGLYVDAPGCVTLDGEQALAFARARHLEYMDDGVWRSDPTGDLGRISRQQLFMRRMFDRVVSEVSFTDVGSLNSLLDVAIDYVTIDRNLELGRAMTVAQQFGTFEGESIVTHALPVEGYTTAGGASVLRYDPIEALPILNTFRDQPQLDLDPELVTVQVSNGSGAPMQATETGEGLEPIGFTVEIAADATETWDRTTVRFAPGAELAARSVARYVTGGADLVEDPTLAEGAVVLVTGLDFTTVATQPLAADDPSIVVVTTTTTVDDGSTDDGTTDDGSGATTTTTAVPETTTTTVGVTPGEPPPGVECEV